MDLFNLSLENVQAAVLVGNLSGVEGEPELESLFFGNRDLSRDGTTCAMLT